MEAEPPGGRARLRADADDGDAEPERREGTSGRRRGKHRHVAPRRLERQQQLRPVERDEVGAKLVGQQAPRPLGRGEQNVAGRPRQSLEQPLLRRRARDQVDLTPRGCGRAADGRDPRGTPVCPAAQLSRGSRTRQDEPVVAVETDRACLDRLERNQRAGDGLEAELLQPLREPFVPALRPGQDDRSAARRASSSPRACGSSPDLRSSQPPSSSATSPVSDDPS